MSDYKFLCPGCGQKISCDTGDAGRVIACPVCQVSFAIPQPSSMAVLPVTAAAAMPYAPAPATGAAAPRAASPAPRQASPQPASAKAGARAFGVVEQVGSNYSALAIASLMCSIILGIGWLPGII